MVKYLISFLVGLLVAKVTLAQSSYLIRGQLEGMDKQAGYSYLTRFGSDEKKVVDSVQVVNGKFTFKGRVAEPNVHMITFSNLNEPVLFVLENKEITLKGSAKDLAGVSLTGSSLTDEYRGYITRYSLPAREELIANTKKAMNLRAKGDSAGAAQIMQDNGQIMRNLTRIARQYIEEHSHSFQSLSLLHGLWKEFWPEDVRRYLNAFPAALQQHSLAKSIATGLAAKEEADAITAIGTQALDFTLPDTAQVPVSLSSFRGKYVLVDFWASWCGPCRQESPFLVRVYQKYKAHGFEILSISLDDDKQKWQRAIAQDHLLWTHVSDLKGNQNKAALLYGVTAIPANFLLDRQGKIIAKELRGKDLEQQLEEVFSKLKQD